MQPSKLQTYPSPFPPLQEQEMSCGAQKTGKRHKPRREKWYCPRTTTYQRIIMQSTSNSRATGTTVNGNGVAIPPLHAARRVLMLAVMVRKGICDRRESIILHLDL